MRFLRRNQIYFVVFITGLCVLVIEILATRILSVYFGNTIYTVTGAITMVLAALSAGYYLGGIAADKKPNYELFYFAILLSGIFVAVIFLVNKFYLPMWGFKMSLVYGPLAASLLLFFMPNLMLGFVPPFAIKLQKQKSVKNDIGSVSGKIFFWSTIGSIIGSLLTGFILIPLMGIEMILVAVACILITVGLIPLATRKLVGRTSVILLVLFITAVGSLLLAGGDNVIYERDGVYEKLIIYDGEFNRRAARFLQQDRSPSGAMYQNSDEMVYEYTKYCALYKLLEKEPRNILLIGGGAYSVPKKLRQELPEARIDVSEIEPSLYNLAQRYFGVTDDMKINNNVIDGRRALSSSPVKYDYIFSDAYRSIYSVPTHLTTKEFYQGAYNVLSNGGMFAANIIGSLDKDYPSFTLSEIKTFHSVFNNSYIFAVDSTEEIGSQNIIFVGVKSGNKLNLSRADEDDTILDNLEQKRVNVARLDLTRHKILSDDYAPVDYLIGQMITNEQ